MTRFHHIAGHLWLVEVPGVEARFEVHEDADPVGDSPYSIDTVSFPNVALACHAYREGYSPNVRYP